MPLSTVSTGRSLRSNAISEFRTLLQNLATCAWFGPDATLTNWPCAVTGINAVAGGSGTTLGTLNGIQCPVFNGSGRYRTASFTSAIAQPYAAVIIAQTSSTSGQVMFDGLTANDRSSHYIAASPRRFGVFAGSGGGVYTLSNYDSAPAVFRSVLNGASSQLAINEVAQSGLNAGTQAPSGLTIGAEYTNSAAFIGPIALVALFAGNQYSNAPIIANAARSLIRV